MEQKKYTEQEYNEAYKRMKEIKGFYTHLFIFVIVNLFILLINFRYYDSIKNWMMTLWTFVPWGIGLGFHAVNVFGFFGIGKSWEERKIKDYLEKRKQEREQLK